MSNVIALPLLPWPADAVTVVAAIAGDERREQTEDVVACECRRCRRALHADTFTVRAALQLPEVVRRGWPVMFFCLPCHLLYDHSGGKGKETREELAGTHDPGDEG